MSYIDVPITLDSAGFGLYRVLTLNGEPWAYLEDLLDDARRLGDVWELGVDELPHGCEDIRGRIKDEPLHVFAYERQDGDGYSYFGIIELDD